MIIQESETRGLISVFDFVNVYFERCVFSLLTLVHNPPIGGKELVNLSPHLLLGFRLRPGPVSSLAFICLGCVFRCSVCCCLLDS